MSPIDDAVAVGFSPPGTLAGGRSAFERKTRLHGSYGYRGFMFEKVLRQADILPTADEQRHALMQLCWLDIQDVLGAIAGSPPSFSGNEG